MGEDEAGVVGVVEAVGIRESAIGGGCGKVVAHHVVHLVAHQTRHHLMAGGQVGSVAASAKVRLLDQQVVAGVAHHWPGVGGRTGGMQHIGGGAPEPSATFRSGHWLPLASPDALQNLYGFSFYFYTHWGLSLSLIWLTLSSPQFLFALQNWFHTQRVTGLSALKDACCSSFHRQATAPHGSLSTAAARLHPGLADLLGRDAEMQSEMKRVLMR